MNNYLEIIIKVVLGISTILWLFTTVEILFQAIVIGLLWLIVIEVRDIRER